jgi:hypothetical protein
MPPFHAASPACPRKRRNRQHMLHEIKHDGFRVIAQKDGNSASLRKPVRTLPLGCAAARVCREAYRPAFFLMAQIAHFVMAITSTEATTLAYLKHRIRVQRSCPAWQIFRRVAALNVRDAKE